MTIRYQTAFSLSILCEYYNQLSSDDFEIIPAPDTVRQLQNYGMRTRISRGKLFVSIRTDAAGKAMFPPPENTKLRFWLKLKNPYFIHLANINLAELAGKKFYFSNLTGTKSGNLPAVSRPISEYTNSISYQPGDLARAGSVIYECIKKVTGAQDTTDTGYWIAKEHSHYASREDMLTLISPVHTFRLSAPATVFSVKVFTHSPSDPNPTQEVHMPEHILTSGGEPTDSVQLTMRHLAPGYYRIHINDEIFDTYLDSHAAAAGCIGIAEIFPYAPEPELSVLDSQGAVIENLSAGPGSRWQDFTILFANRRLFWKYVSTGNSVQAVSDSLYQFNRHPALPEKVNYFLSDQPMPLTENPRMITIDVPVQAGNSPIRVPVPDPRSAGALSQHEDNFYYTIFLNY